MKVAFLGSAGSIPGAGKANTSIVVASSAASETASTIVQVDCSGTPLAALAAIGVDPLAVDVLVLSHTHTDHLYALPSFIHGQLMLGRTRPLSIWGEVATLDRGSQILGVFGLLSRCDVFGLNWIPITTGVFRTLPGGGLAVMAFPVEHSVPTLGLLFEEGDRRLCYSCDTRPCAALTAASQGAAVLVHEASGVSAREIELNAAGHSSARQAGLAASEAGAERLFIVHLPREVQAEGTEAESFLAEARSSFSGDAAIPDLFRWYDVGS
ncbi:MAG: MBL fold metallo-hydrolase [Spirochaetaceae bacterium]